MRIQPAASRPHALDLAGMLDGLRVPDPSGDVLVLLLVCALCTLRDADAHMSREALARQLHNKLRLLCCEYWDAAPPDLAL